MAAALVVMSTAGFGEQRMIAVGERKIAVYCDGKSGGNPTVILVPAGGRTAKDWATIQPRFPNSHGYAATTTRISARAIRLQCRCNRWRKS